MRSPYTQQKFTMQALTLWACATFLAACGGGGGGGGGGAIPAAAAAPAGASAVDLAWGASSGPVAGYSVFVERESNGAGVYQHEADVTTPAVTLTGDPGEQARIVVVPFDSNGVRGPGSAPSDQFAFPDPNANAQPANLASAPAAPAAMPQVAAAEAQETPAETPSGSLLEATDLAGRLVWDAGDALQITDASLDTLLLFARPEPGSELAALADFDGDGVGDLLWVSAAGEVAYTPAAALAAESGTPLVPLGALAEGEGVQAADDFDGDGLGDVLVAGADGLASLWLTNPGADADVVAAGSTGTSQLAGTGDFDGNGSSDVAWLSSDGGLDLWLMDAGAPSVSVSLDLDEGLEVATTGDFDGNGTAELALRDATGSLSILYPLATPVAVEGTDVLAAGGLAPAGASDVDRDGTEDLVLVGSDQVRTAYLPGEQLAPIDPESPWEFVALIP